MNFTLYYSGYAGGFSATLYEGALYEGENQVANKTGLKSARAARRWGKAQAALLKAQRAAKPSKSHNVSINGHRSFTL